MSNPADMGSMFGGGNRSVYPPAPPGYKYVNLDIPQAPPGYNVQRMSSIANNNSGAAPGAGVGGRQRYQYQYGAHSPEGIRERAQELQRLRNGTRVGGGNSLTQTPGATPSTSGNPVQAMWDRVDQGGNAGAPQINPFLLGPRGPIEPPAPHTQNQAYKKQQQGLAYNAAMEKLLGKLPSSGQITPGSRETGYNITNWRDAPDTALDPSTIDLRQPTPPAATPPSGPLPGLPQSAAPSSDTTTSHMESRDVPMPRSRPELSMYRAPLPRQDPRTMGPEADENWKWAQGIAAEHEAKSKGSMIPQVLQDIWTHMTAPAGPAFDPNNANIDEQRYNPLPNAQEQ